MVEVSGSHGMVETELMDKSGVGLPVGRRLGPSGKEPANDPEKWQEDPDQEHHPVPLAERYEPQGEQQDEVDNGPQPNKPAAGHIGQYIHRFAVSTAGLIRALT